MVEHFLFDGDAAGGGETAETAIRAQDAMAGDDQRDRVARHDAAHSPSGVRTTHLRRQAAVSRCPAESYLSARLQDSVREGTRSVEAYGGIGSEIHGFALVVRHDPLLEISLEVFITLELIARRMEALEQLLLNFLALWTGQEGPADSIIRASQPEITPFCAEDSVPEHNIVHSR